VLKAEIWMCSKADGQRQKSLQPRHKPRSMRSWMTYDAKAELTSRSQRTVTRYTYDPKPFDLIRLYTRRSAVFHQRLHQQHADDPRPHACGVQNLQYTYDPVGNIPNSG